MSFSVDDEVLLSTRNLNLTGLPKLKDRYIGPFVVQQRIGEVAYRLDLSSRAALRNVHPVFHVSLLRQWRSNGLRSTAPPVDIDDETEFEVHRIKAHCMHRNELQFLMSFVGFDSSEDMWLSAG